MKTRIVKLEYVLFILNMVLFYGVSMALDPSQSVHFYHHQTWAEEEGLPQNSVISLAQTPDGYLWVGTEAGLVRFDGVHFNVFNHENTPAFIEDIVTYLKVDSKGALWITTRGSGLIRCHDGGFKAFRTKDGLITDELWCTMESRDGSLWIGTRTGLNRLDGGKIEAVLPDSTLSKSWIRSMCEDRKGCIWIGTALDGLFLLKKRGERYECESKGFLGERIYALLEDRKGTIWVGTSNSGLIGIHGNTREMYNTKNGFSGNLVYTLYEDRGGNIWVGTYGNAINILNPDNKKITIVDDRDIIPSNIVYSILEDREGSMWIGTDGAGLTRLGDSKVCTYTMKSGLSYDNVFGAFEDSTGKIWTGTKGYGVNCIDPKTQAVRTFTIKDGLASNLVVSIAECPKGCLWFGFLEGGITRLCMKDKKVDSFTLKNGLLDNNVGVLYVDPKGTLWAGTHNGGIHWFDGNHFNFYTNVKYRINSLLIDRKGNFWIGSFGGGLCQIKGGKSECFQEKTTFPIRNVSGILEDSAGNIWVNVLGTGLNCIRNGKIIQILKKNGLPDDTIYSLVEDLNHHLWASSNHGIFCLNRKEIDSLLEGKSTWIDCTLYGKEDGMKSLEGNAGNQPSICRARDGKLYFPTTRGLSVIDPDNIPVNLIAPPVHIEYATFDGKLFTNKKYIRIPPGKGNIRFSFTGLSFVFPKKIRFKYKLEGFDKEWIDAGSRRSVDYPDIPPGDYTFRVIARNSDGIWNYTGDSFRFHLQPRYYQTTGFKVIFPSSVILFSGFFYFSIVKFRYIRKLRRKYKRTSLTPESSDTFLKRILYTIEVEKVFRDPDLTLKTFSEKIKIPPRAISIVINEHLKRNFFELINYYRIKEAQEMLKDTKKNNRSILEVGYEVGFNSKTAFNRAFKQFAKVAPSVYKKKYVEPL